MKITRLNTLAKGSVGFDVDGTPKIMTDKGWSLLIAIGTGRHLVGAQVRTARTLEETGLAVIEDNGELKPGGRIDGERYYARRTALGHEIVRASQLACDR